MTASQALWDKTQVKTTVRELAKITGSLSHILIATLKLSDKHAAQRQQELTSAQRRIEQLEREAQVRQEGTDEVEQDTEEETNRLKETLEATSHEMQQLKEDFADVQTSYSMQRSYWRRQRLTSGTKTAESRPSKFIWLSQGMRSAA